MIPSVGRRTGRRASCIAAAVLAVLATRARADRLDGATIHPIRVGVPSGPAPMSRVDPRRSSSTSAELPSRPRLLWRARVPPSIVPPAAVDDRGAIVLATTGGEVVQLDAQGRTDWTSRTDGVPSSGPVLTSGGARWVLVSDAVLALDARGRPQFRASIPMSRGHIAGILPTDGGGGIVSSGRDVARLAWNGSIELRARVAEPIVDLLAEGPALIVVAESGVVHRWLPPSAPRLVGSFAGVPVDGAALTPERKLVAVVDQKRMVELDLATGVRSVRVSQIAPVIAGPPALCENGETRLVTLEGALLGHDSQGREALRVPLEPTAAGFAGPALQSGALPPIVVDPRRTVAFALRGVDVGVALASGEVHTAAGAACAEPVSVAPAGRGRFVVACRSGDVLMIGETHGESSGHPL